MERGFTQRHHNLYKILHVIVTDQRKLFMYVPDLSLDIVQTR